MTQGHDPEPTTVSAEEAIAEIVSITQDWNLGTIPASEAMHRILEALQRHSGEDA